MEFCVKPDSFPFADEDDEDEDDGELPFSRSIWAFCLITSAGARTRHEAISATADAVECTRDSCMGRAFPMTVLACS